MKKRLLLAVMAVLALTTYAYDFEVNGLCYNFTSNNTVELTHKQFNEYQSNSRAYPYTIGNLIIPTAVEYLEKEYSVTSISDYAFMRSNVTSVYIPYTITNIGEFAFGYNSGITKVTIPYSVTYVGRYAFDACYSLESVTICNPSTIFIGGDAFQECQIDTLNLIGNGASRFNHYSGYVGNIDAIHTVNIGSGITSLSDTEIDSTATTINCYAELPPSCGEWTFMCYNAELHVPPVSTVSYFTADFWSNFSNLINDLSDKVSLNKTNANLVQWETLALTTTAIIGGSKVVWSTSNPNVAIVNEDGVVTAISEGECDIFATLESNIAVYASCHIISSYPEIIALTLNANEIAFSNVGDKFTLIATTNPENSGPTPTWVSSDETVATVDENGVVTAMGEGECDITVSVIDKTATCHVTVNSTIIISLDQQDAAVLPNHIIVLTPSASPVMPDGFTVTSSDPSVAVARLMNGKVQVVGIKEGTTMITVGSTDGKALPATCLVTVYTEPGDVNCDGFVNISDVTDLIDYLLGSDVVNFKAGNADLDGDGNVNIADVTELIDFLLSNGN